MHWEENILTKGKQMFTKVEQILTEREPFFINVEQIFKGWTNIQWKGTIFNKME
jgi:hypothetical protein